MELKKIFSKEYCLEYPREPYIIAEAGFNHEGSLDVARRLIDDAIEAGADAIKFQAYKAKTLTSKYSPAFWDLKMEPATNQYDLYKRHDNFWKNEFVSLKKICEEVEIEFLCTPFDFESADFLNDLLVAFKISSSDITNKPLIDHVCKFNKPIILSTGASTLEEIKRAVSWIKSEGNPLSLLHCVLNYPNEDKNAHLGAIIGLKKAFPDLIIGYSDHTMAKQMEIPVVASILGAVIIEKHFTHDKKLSGYDHMHAMDKEDLKLFKNKIKTIYRLIGDYKVRYLPCEELSRKNARRSIVAVEDLKKRQILKKEHITFKRPAFGISPAEYEKVIGLKMKRSVKADEVLTWEDLYI